MKVIVDVNLSAAWVQFLREKGHDVEHWSMIGEHNADDLAIMAHARSIDAIILTGDMDFAEIHAFESSVKPSVIQLRTKDMLPYAMGALVARALTIGASNLAIGAVITIKGSRMRIAKLPIGTTEPR